MKKVVDNDELGIWRISASDPYSYWLQLLYMLFSKDELASSLVSKSKKSDEKQVKKLSTNTLEKGHLLQKQIVEIPS